MYFYKPCFFHYTEKAGFPHHSSMNKWLGFSLKQREFSEPKNGILSGATEVLKLNPHLILESSLQHFLKGSFNLYLVTFKDNKLPLFLDNLPLDHSNNKKKRLTNDSRIYSNNFTIPPPSGLLTGDISSLSRKLRIPCHRQKLWVAWPVFQNSQPVGEEDLPSLEIPQCTGPVQGFPKAAETHMRCGPLESVFPKAIWILN